MIMIFYQMQYVFLESKRQAITRNMLIRSHISHFCRFMILSDPGILRIKKKKGGGKTFTSLP